MPAQLRYGLRGLGEWEGLDGASIRFAMCMCVRVSLCARAAGCDGNAILHSNRDSLLPAAGGTVVNRRPCSRDPYMHTRIVHVVFAGCVSSPMQTELEKYASNLTGECWVLTVDSRPPWVSPSAQLSAVSSGHCSCCFCDCGVSGGGGGCQEGVFHGGRLRLHLLFHIPGENTENSVGCPGPSHID